jgi:hypothetical protein
MQQAEPMAMLTDWEALSLEVMQDRRKGKRVPLAFPIEVSGFDRTGHLFAERTMTSNISKNGCGFLVKTPLHRGDVVAIKLIGRQDGHSPASKPLLFQIMWSTRTAAGWRAGALRLQPEGLWPVAFPASNQLIPPVA